LTRSGADSSIGHLPIDKLYMPAERRNEILPGTLEMLVLKTLSLGPLHGYGIAQHIRQLSRDVLQVEEGSLYPALQRMELKGLVSAEWKLTPTKRRARYYRLTAAGRKQLGVEQSSFARLVEAIANVMQPEA
jgi:PadR family transcriptional regulator, regulatory protein PadR